MGRRRKSRARPPYHSIFEEKIADDLERQDIKFKYEKETLVYVQPAQTRKYTPDFFLPNGIIVEAKGKWTIEDRKKMILVIEQNPKLDIRMLFQYDNKINRGSKTRYSTWCQKRNMKWAVGKEIPKEWLTQKLTNAQKD